LTQARGIAYKMDLQSKYRGACALVADHPEYEELCALFSAGAVDEREVSRLEEHLSGCADCRRYLEQFARKAVVAMGELAPQRAPEVSLSNSFDLDNAKKRVLERLQDEMADDDTPAGGRMEYAIAGMPGNSRNRAVLGKPLVFVQSFKPYLPYAAGFFLALGLSLTLYWNGPRTQADEFRLSAERAERDAAVSRQEVKEQSQLRETLNTELQQRAEAVVALRGQIRQLQLRINELESVGAKAEQEKQDVKTSKEGLSKNLLDAQTTVAALKNELDSSARQRANESFRVADLERRTEQLTGTVRDQKVQIEQQDAELVQQRDLLAYDRDIRDLVSARNLYISEVSDSDENGKQKKPYARVFYTKDKSLIYYGFDLDLQPGVKDAGTFQVWGRRESNRGDALNLGILYHDSSTNKRWVLKINDPMKLQQIDAIFLTMEPKGGSVQPTGKHFLFAYLRFNPNHP